MQRMSKLKLVLIGVVWGFAALTGILNLTISLLTHEDIGAVLRGAGWALFLAGVIVGLGIMLDAHIVGRPLVYIDRESQGRLTQQDSQPLPAPDTSNVKKVRSYRLVDELSRVADGRAPRRP